MPGWDILSCCCWPGPGDTRNTFCWPPATTGEEGSRPGLGLLSLASLSFWWEVAGLAVVLGVAGVLLPLCCLALT